MNSVKQTSTYLQTKTIVPPGPVLGPGIQKKPQVKGLEQVLPQENYTPSLTDPSTVTEEKASPEQTEQVKPKLSTPRPGSDMAIMLEDFEAAKLAGGDLKSNSNGTLVVLQEPLLSENFSEPPASHNEEGDKNKTDTILGGTDMVEKLGHEANHAAGHGHGHTTDALLGGHLGTEVVEKVGHSAHHAVGHGASAKAHGAAELTQAKLEGAHQTAETLSQAKAHGVGHAITEAKSEVAGTVANTAGHKASSLGDAGSEVTHHGTEVAHHLSQGLQTALGVSATASLGLGGVMLYTGSKELAAGIKEKSGEKIAEGVGGLAVGARSVAASAVMTSMITSSGTVAQVAAVAGQALTPLGIVHGAIDMGLGVKDLVKGDKVDGLVKIGFGTTVIAGALVGGIPLTVAALGFLGVKVGRGIIKGNKAKKAAALEAQKQASPEPPAETGSTSTKEAKA